MARRYLVPAADVTAVRTALHLTQRELATRLGVTRRTVIRGEQRGLEIPSSYGDSPRKAVGEAWRELKAQAAGALALQAKEAEADKRRRQNADAARRYRKRRRVTNAPRSQRKSHRARARKSDTSAASRRAAKIRKRDKLRKIPAKKSPRRAGRRRVRK